MSETLRSQPPLPQGDMAVVFSYPLLTLVKSYFRRTNKNFRHCEEPRAERSDPEPILSLSKDEGERRRSAGDEAITQRGDCFVALGLDTCFALLDHPRHSQ